MAADPAMFANVTAQASIDLRGHLSKVIQPILAVPLVELQLVGKMIPGKPGVLNTGTNIGGTAELCVG